MKFLILLILFSLLACAHDPYLKTEENVNLGKYQGKWYEIGRFDNNFQKQCLGTRAQYRLVKKKVIVSNECQREDKTTKVAKGIAFVENTQTNAELSVSFVPLVKYFGWFTGDYNIIELDEDYQFVLVGSKNRNYLWILAREKKLSPNIIEKLLNIARDNGFDISRFHISPVWSTPI